jgi:hypothetical protein
MKKIKKLLATALLGSLILMQVMPAYAEELGTGGTGGDSTVEAYVDTDIYNVVLPTMANVNFTVDPQGLLYIADDEAYTTESGAIYFAHPVDATYADSSLTVGSDGTDLTPSGTLDEEIDYFLKDTTTTPVSYVDYSGITAADLANDGVDSPYENTDGDYVLYNVDVAAHNTYSNTSEAMEIINKSSFAVDLDFSVTTAADGISLVASDALAASTDPSLSLEITATSNADGASPATEAILDAAYDADTQALDDADTGYSIVSHEAEDDFPNGTTTVQGSTSNLYYAYLLDDGYSTFSTMTYEISGSCNNVDGWGSLAEEDGVTLAITWTINSHSVDTAPSTSSVTYSKGAPVDATFTIDLGFGDLAATTISDILITTNDGTLSLNGTSGSNPALAAYFAIDNTAHTATILSDVFCENLPISTYVVQIILDDDISNTLTTSLIVTE